VLRLAGHLIPMRELGKAAFLQALDASRCAARVLGARLAEAGYLAEAEDVFFLTYDELIAGVDSPVHELVAARREDHRRYGESTLPPAWTGNPVPERTEPAAEDPGTAPRGDVITAIEGIPICGDTVTGVARVVTDPRDADLEPGEILVCRTTDPSWTPLFLVASALVIDTGGAMSHGAIVARELGITCVVNTGSGTRDIPDGATVTVDGRTGRVTLADERSRT
jgi:pyruvate,water dikinase